MGRGRVKGKKLLATSQDNAEEEKVVLPKRRGRPQKSLKDEMDENEAQKMEDEDYENTTGPSNKDAKTKSTINGKKRTRNNARNKEKVEVGDEENGNGARSSITEELNRSNGFRQNGNRRKSKPQRAAESVVECN